MRLSATCVLCLAGAACGANEAGGSSTPERRNAVQPASPSRSPDDPQQADPSGVAVAVEIIDTDFRPPVVTVQAGTEVNWTQIGDQPHSVSAADGSFDSSPRCGPIDSDECLGMGDVFSHSFDAPGTYVYYCRVHGLPDGTGMVGKIVVRPESRS